MEAEMFDKLMFSFMRWLYLHGSLRIRNWVQHFEYAEMERAYLHVDPTFMQVLRTALGNQLRSWMFELRGRWFFFRYELGLNLIARLVVALGNLRDSGHGDYAYMRRRVLEDVEDALDLGDVESQQLYDSDRVPGYRDPDDAPWDAYTGQN
jgi:hypothetical protein